MLGGHEIVEGGGLSSSNTINVGDVDVLGGQVKVSSEGLRVTLELRFSLNLKTSNGNSPGVGVSGRNNLFSGLGLDEVFSVSTNVELSNSVVNVDGEGVLGNQLAGQLEG